MTTLPSILDNDLTDVSAAFPVFPAGVYNVSISEIKPEQAKLKEGQTEPGTNLVITIRTAQPYKDREGRLVNTGFPITDRVSLTPTEKYPTESIDRRLKEILVAVFGEDVKGSFGQYYREGLLLNKPLTVKLIIRVDEKGQHPDSNQVRNYVQKT